MIGVWIPLDEVPEVDSLGQKPVPFPAVRGDLAWLTGCPARVPACVPTRDGALPPRPPCLLSVV